ncbi:hypothetical protein D1871_20885 [Nakamurella silvestris]|nr:hypothetical protein D1871_20885 [Nakamurella silvestris]
MFGLLTQRRFFVPALAGLLAVGTLPPAPALADTGLHAYTLTVRSIYVNDDGDKGAYGPGDFHVMQLWIHGQNNAIHIDNGHGWFYGVANRVWQHYSSDTNYPIGKIDDANSGNGAGTVGQSVAISGEAHELDNLPAYEVRALTDTHFTVPPAGSHQDFPIQLEATHGKSHIRLTITFRITTA